MNKSFSILFVISFLLVNSCLWMQEDIDVVDWLKDREMQEGMTYGEAGKTFRTWDTLTIPKNVTIIGSSVDFQHKVIISEGVTINTGGVRPYPTIFAKEDIIVNGIELNPATFTGSIILSVADSYSTIFRHVLLNGSLSSGTGNYKRSLLLENSTIRNGAGLYLPDSSILKISNCTFEQNEPYDITLGNGNIEHIDTTNRFDKGIVIDSFCKIGVDLTLPACTYTLKRGMEFYGDVTITEGTRFEIDSISGVSVTLGGSISIAGTVDNPVVFNGGKYALWLTSDSIQTIYENSITNTIFTGNTLTEHSDLYKNAGIKAGIVVMGVNLRMNSCDITDYYKWAVQLKDNASFVYENCTGFDSSHILNDTNSQ